MVRDEVGVVVCDDVFVVVLVVVTDVVGVDVTVVVCEVVGVVRIRSITIVCSFLGSVMVRHFNFYSVEQKLWCFLIVYAVACIQ